MSIHQGEIKKLYIQLTCCRMATLVGNGLKYLINLLSFLILSKLVPTVCESKINNKNYVVSCEANKRIGWFV